MKKRTSDNEFGVNMEALTNNAMDLASDALGQSADILYAIRENKKTTLSAVAGLCLGHSAISEGDVVKGVVGFIATANALKGLSKFKRDLAESRQAREQEIARLDAQDTERTQETEETEGNIQEVDNQDN